jgi:CHAT domain-containing protein/glycosyltransferase involved in cell wall biosynthesis
MRGLKYFRIIVLTLCCATACNDEDTSRAGEWRTLEARLSTEPQWREFHPVAKPAIPPKPDKICYQDVPSHAHAVALLKKHPQCIDEAIDHLGRFARTDARAMNDVVVAYYTRAKLQERPTDLFTAYQFAGEAVRTDANSPAARFNHALIEEELGLNTQAIASWETFLRLETDERWEKEARTRLNRLRNIPTAQWEENKTQLAAALSARDAARVARLIERAPLGAQEYFEGTLLPQWAQAPSPKALEELRLYANVLSARLNNDPFVRAVVETLDGSREGILAYARGREVGANNFAVAAQHYAAASRYLAASGNPLRLLADMRLADAESYRPEHRAVDLLTRIERDAARLGYRQLLGRIRWNRATIVSFESRYLEGIRDYDLALSDFRQVRDEQNVVNLYIAKSGVYRYLGHYELAAQSALAAVREAWRSERSVDRHKFWGELSDLAMALGHPAIARIYQDAAVNAASKQGHDEAARHATAIALRKRAAIYLHLGRVDDAQGDLTRAHKLIDAKDPLVEQLLSARHLEIAARTELDKTPAMAAATLTRAIALADPKFRTFYAVLHAQRAEAYARAGDTNQAIGDLRTAVHILREEEQAILDRRSPAQGDELWPAYFSRFDATWRALIEKLIEKRDFNRAFEYVEKARAFEPLTLVLQRQQAVISRTARELAAGMTITDIQKSLQPGTFLFEYYVAGEITYVWVVSDKTVEVFARDASLNDIVRWTEDIQREAVRRQSDALETRLNAPFGALLSAPLTRIAKQPIKRIIIVPDPSMYGLPFPALRDSATGRYLVELAPIEIAYSAALYRTSLDLDARLPKTDTPSSLLFGNPSFDRSLAITRTLENLIGAESEVRRIQNLYAPYAEVRMNEAATVPEFLGLAPQHTVLHIAAHGIVNPHRPTESLILLAPSNGDSGALTAAQLMNALKLEKTRLVVLSACSSAGGAPPGRGGVAPLVRPILAAGVPAVIGSLWDVEDTTTPDLLVSFHSAWRSGDDAATALRRAQVSAIAKGTSPLVWAPFQVIGHASSPKESSR